jgi:MFS family permease
MSGSALGWLASQAFTDLRGPLTSYGSLDVLVLGLAGASIGGLFLGFTALRRGGRPLVEAAAGAAIGMLAAVLAGMLGVAIGTALSRGGGRQAFLFARLIVFGLFGGGVGAAVAARFTDIDRRRPIDGFVFGLLAGVVAGLILSMPGPTQTWQLLAFLVVGLGVGFGASRIRRAVGIVSTAPTPGRPGDLLGHREWELYDGQSVVLDGGTEVRAAAGRVRVESPGAAAVTLQATLSGLPITDSVELRERQTIAVGARRYQFSRLPKVG